MDHAQRLDLPRSRPKLEGIVAVRPAALRWFAGLYFLTLGASLLLLPPGSLGPWLDVIWLRGASAAVAGIALLWMPTVQLRPRAAAALCAVVLAPQVVIGAEYARLGIYAPAALLWLLALAVTLAPIATSHADELPRPDALGLVLGLAQSVQGIELLLRPGAVVMVPAGLGVPHQLVGALFLLAGVAVVATQLAPQAPRSAVIVSHVLSGSLLLGLWAAQALLTDPVYWVLGVAVGLRGAAIAALPWWGARAAAIDSSALQVRLALALVTAAVVPLLILLPILIGAFEERRVERGLERAARESQLGAWLLSGADEDDATIRAQLARALGEHGEIGGVALDDGRIVVLRADAAAPPDVVWQQAVALASSGTPAAMLSSLSGPWLIGAARVPGRPWTVVSAIPRAALVADLTALRQLSLALIVCTTLAAGLIGWWMAVQLTRPMRWIALWAARIAGGDRTASPPRGGPSELAHLSGAVVRMANALDARLAEREQLVAMLRRQNDELREHERAREEWIRALSHDLRSPLTAMSGNAQRLDRIMSERGAEREARMARTIVVQGQRLDEMIADLADTLRADAGAVETRREPVELAGLLTAVREEIGEPDQVARIRLELAHGAPPAFADRRLVVRIVTNLLTNALKYSPPGSPVALRLECVEHEALVTVADQGGGLSSEEQASLFSRYYRAERTRAMAPGLGLGLYVTRALVEAHGGRIWVESRPGEGATFRFTLPLHLEGGASPRPDVVQ